MLVYMLKVESEETVISSPKAAVQVRDFSLFGSFGFVDRRKYVSGNW